MARDRRLGGDGGARIVAIGALLGGALTTEGRADEQSGVGAGAGAAGASLPGTLASHGSVIVSSERYTVDSPQFRACGGLAGELRGIDGVAA